MGYQSERQIIETRFQTLWVDGSGEPLTPVAYDKQVSDDFELADKPWVRLRIMSGVGQQITIGAPGNNGKRHAGVLAVQINTLVGTGSEESRALADKLEGFFQNVLVENILFTIPFPADGEVVQGRWSTWTIYCPFTRDEFNA